ncbi:TetR/AcrR family transcriptional regulator [Kitasatospora sp. NPDC001309]|uniref:TetR/AcrR family transcriptional regulator n=1 Tax=Kitasatospora sp. NPDC001309 TaxID=3364013 RepID=UPI0036C3A193
MGADQTRKKILTAFLALAGEQGMAAITTKEIAAAAGVNEVTLFRHFGDKANLALEAVKAFSPAAQIDAFEPKIDASSPETTIEGLLACVEAPRVEDEPKVHAALKAARANAVWLERVLPSRRFRATG